ncbi:Isochorismatase hydrolase [Trichodelitschia bisporula]|uniref:Isochorismatase hydrolase n=1 Tax=Trichodelitschia bisporula TaxID=703511 RepID=A0A6G1HKJ1_9PEZI|nr:Isochorismatase hydrolase [Trichodelitschia bisporula]
MPSFRNDILGVPPSTASPNDSTLLIIDAQNEYATGALKVSNLDISRPAIKTLLERYRAAGGHVVHITHEVPDGAPVFTPGTALAAEFDELAPREGEPVVSKKFPGSFAGTGLKEILEGKGVKKVVLVGYMAHVCVSTTAREAYQLGFDVVIAGDAIGDRDIPGASGDEVTRIVLLELADCFGTVVSSADIK